MMYQTGGRAWCQQALQADIPSHWCGDDHLFASRCHIARLLISEQEPVLVCQQESRGDGVDPDTCRSKVDCKPLCEVVDCSLGGRVCGYLRERPVGVHRGDVKDTSAAFLHHIFAEDHGRQHGTLEVKVEDPVKPFYIEIEKGPFQVFIISADILFGRLWLRLCCRPRS